MTERRRVVVTVCPRERGTVRLPLVRGQRRRRLDAAGVARALRALVDARGLGARVTVGEGCVGGCRLAGPNVGVTLYPPRRPGGRDDHVAVGWRSYVYSLPTLDCLARVIDENLA
jgi:hypothetical protein